MKLPTFLIWLVFFKCHAFFELADFLFCCPLIFGMARHFWTGRVFLKCFSKWQVIFKKLPLDLCCHAHEYQKCEWETWGLLIFSRLQGLPKGQGLQCRNALKSPFFLRGHLRWPYSGFKTRVGEGRRRSNSVLHLALSSLGWYSSRECAEHEAHDNVKRVK